MKEANALVPSMSLPIVIWRMGRRDSGDSNMSLNAFVGRSGRTRSKFMKPANWRHLRNEQNFSS